MSTVTVSRIPRHGLVVATAAAIHAAAFLALTSVVVTRVRIEGPSPITGRILPPPVESVVPVAPDVPGAVEFEWLPEPAPRIEWPREDQTPAAGHGPSTAATGGGEAAGVGPADYVGPVLRMGDARLAGLIDRCYPAAARRRNEAGRVDVRVTIDAAGTAGAYGVAQGSGFPALDAAVGCVLRRLEFEPARRDGSAVEATVQLPVVFRLD